MFILWWEWSRWDYIFLDGRSHHHLLTRGQWWGLGLFSTDHRTGNKYTGFSIANKTDKTIMGVFVLPAYEGRGARRCLMQAAEDWLWTAVISEIWLVTGHNPNLRTYGFYEQD
ncbi:MAG: GNAT family N-acetyltransferase [Cyanobacteria bacterium P01_F01_bin.150]